MWPKLLQQMCRVYAALVSVLTFYSILVFTKCLPYVDMRHYELVLGRAQDVAVLLGLLLVLAGVLTTFVCSWLKVELPGWHVNFILLAIVVFVFNLMFLPPITVA